MSRFKNEETELKDFFFKKYNFIILSSEGDYGRAENGLSVFENV